MFLLLLNEGKHVVFMTCFWIQKETVTWDKWSACSFLFLHPNNKKTINPNYQYTVTLGVMNFSIPHLKRKLQFLDLSIWSSVYPATILCFKRHTNHRWEEVWVIHLSSSRAGVEPQQLAVKPRSQKVNTVTDVLPLCCLLDMHPVFL